MFRKITLGNRVFNGAILASSSIMYNNNSVVQTPLRMCATADQAQNNNNNNNNRRRVRQAVQQRTRRALLPPAFDIVHWNDEDVSKGHLLRFLLRDSFIVLEYNQQVAPIRGESTGTGEDGETTTTRTRRADKSKSVVTLTLNPVYIARFLGVLEGKLPSVEVQSRLTNGSFKPNPVKGKHHYTLACTSVKPTTGQQLAADGSDMKEETIEWNVEFDVAESLLLERFLTQALHYNTGFARRIY